MINLKTKKILLTLLLATVAIGSTLFVGTNTNLFKGSLPITTDYQSITSSFNFGNNNSQTIYNTLQLNINYAQTITNGTTSYQVNNIPTTNPNYTISADIIPDANKTIDKCLWGNTLDHNSNRTEQLREMTKSSNTFTISLPFSSLADTSFGTNDPNSYYEYEIRCNYTDGTTLNFNKSGSNQSIFRFLNVTKTLSGSTTVPVNGQQTPDLKCQKIAQKSADIKHLLDVVFTKYEATNYSKYDFSMSSRLFILNTILFPIDQNLIKDIPSANDNNIIVVLNAYITKLNDLNCTTIFTIYRQTPITITSLNPTQGPVNTEVEISGTGFTRINPEQIYVLFTSENNRNTFTKATYNSENNTIEVKVPTDAKTGIVKLFVNLKNNQQIGTLINSDKTFTVTDTTPDQPDSFIKPKVIWISPADANPPTGNESTEQQEIITSNIDYISNFNLVWSINNPRNYPITSQTLTLVELDATPSNSKVFKLNNTNPELQISTLPNGQFSISKEQLALVADSTYEVNLFSTYNNPNNNAPIESKFILSTTNQIIPPTPFTVTINNPAHDSTNLDSIEQPINVTTNKPASCSYKINGQEAKDFSKKNETTHTAAEQKFENGPNTLTVTCTTTATATPTQTATASSSFTINDQLKITNFSTNPVLSNALVSESPLKISLRTTKPAVCYIKQVGTFTSNTDDDGYRKHSFNYNLNNNSSYDQVIRCVRIEFHQVATRELKFNSGQVNTDTNTDNNNTTTQIFKFNPPSTAPLGTIVSMPFELLPNQNVPYLRVEIKGADQTTYTNLGVVCNRNSTNESVNQICTNNNFNPTNSLVSPFNTPIRWDTNQKLGTQTVTAQAYDLRISAINLANQSQTDTKRITLNQVRPSATTGSRAQRSCSYYFADMRDTDRLCGEVAFLREQGIFFGQETNNNTRIANLSASLLRSEYFAIATRLRGNQNLTINRNFLLTFRDITPAIINNPQNAWWLESVSNLQGIVRGFGPVGQKTLAPTITTTQAEVGKVAAEALIRGFRNDDQKEPWFEDTRNLYNRLRINFSPNAVATRGNAVELIFRTIIFAEQNR